MVDLEVVIVDKHAPRWFLCLTQLADVIGLHLPMPLDNLDLILHIFGARLLPVGTSDRIAEDARTNPGFHMSE